MRDSQRCACSSAREGSAGRRGRSVSRLASTASSIAASKWSAVHLDVGQVGHEQGGVGRRRALLERLAGGGDVASAAASGSFSISARRAASACRQATQLRLGRLSARASSASSSRARKAVASSRALAASSRHSTAERSPGATRAGLAGHASLQLAGRPARAGRVCRWRGSFPRVGTPARTRPHYPRRMPGTPPSTPPTRFAYLGPEGTFAEAALISARCLLGGSPVPPAECRRPPWPPSDRVTPTPRWCRWRTPSRARCPPRWTGWPTATRW